MNWNEKILSEVDRYLEGTLSEEERTHLEKRLREDAQFKRDFDLYQSFFQSPYTADEQSFLQKLSDIHDEKARPATSWIWKAILLILTALLIGWLVLNKTQTRAQKIHVPMAQDISLTTKSGHQQNDQKILVEKYYNTGQYSQASDIFEQLVLEEPEDLTLKQLLGQSYFYGLKYDNAIDIFKEITDDPNALEERKEEAQLWICYSLAQKGDLGTVEKGLGRLMNSKQPSIRHRAEVLMKEVQSVQ